MEQLQAMEQDLEAHYVLVEDIDAGETETWHDGDGFDPVGEYDWYDNVGFRGSFDGHGFEIRDLYIDRSEENFVGLFGYTENADVKNVGVVDADVTGDWYVGGLVGGNANGGVSGCYATGNVSGENCVGGLVGLNHEGVVSNSFWDVEASGVEDSDGGADKNTEEMKASETFVDAGWDFDEIWDIDENEEINEGYPVLKWQVCDLVVEIVGEGSTVPSSGTHTYESGEEVTITAAPAEGWYFEEWMGDETGTEKTITIAMEEDEELTAHFKEEEGLGPAPSPEEIEDMTPGEAAEILTASEPSSAAETLEQLSLDTGSAILSALLEREEFESLNVILQEMDAPALNGIFGKLTAEERDDLYRELSGEVQEKIDRDSVSEDSGGDWTTAMIVVGAVVAAAAVGIFYYVSVK